MSHLDKISAEIEPLTPELKRRLQNIIDFHGANKENAAKRVAQILKQPFKVNKIHGILTS
jgi:hypothetical protein